MSLTNEIGETSASLASANLAASMPLAVASWMNKKHAVRVPRNAQGLWVPFRSKSLIESSSTKPCSGMTCELGKRGHHTRRSRPDSKLALLHGWRPCETNYFVVVPPPPLPQLDDFVSGMPLLSSLFDTLSGLKALFAAVLVTSTAIAVAAAHVALTRPPERPMADKITDKVYDLCHSDQTVSSELAKDPKLAPHKASHDLYGAHPPSVTDSKPPEKRVPATKEDLERAYQCGKFGNLRPSELFLRIYHDALKTLEHDPLMGVVSPPLMGSSGVVPLTIVGSMHDICRHMSNLIARAEKEVFLGTNYWMKSKASQLITDSFKELSRRAGERGEKAVVKLLYDRGNPKQLLDPHQSVDESTRVSKNVGLPPPSEMPNVDLQVVNYHRFPLGTFHAKFMIVDRKYAVLSSNNVQVSLIRAA